MAATALMYHGRDNKGKGKKGGKKGKGMWTREVRRATSGGFRAVRP